MGAEFGGYGGFKMESQRKGTKPGFRNHTNWVMRQSQRLQTHSQPQRGRRKELRPRASRRTRSKAKSGQDPPTALQPASPAGRVRDWCPIGARASLTADEQGLRLPAGHRPRPSKAPPRPARAGHVEAAPEPRGQKGWRDAPLGRMRWGSPRRRSALSWVLPELSRGPLRTGTGAARRAQVPAVIGCGSRDPKPGRGHQASSSCALAQSETESQATPRGGRRGLVPSGPRALGCGSQPRGGPQQPLPPAIMPMV
ncbi:proline-rich protein 2-like isoform X1 [Camelus ferus]|uniref:Proline-rich protein 2-like isoform X1 n=1 Tax=Camelus ferus TaxID=419612 RepID=A0A8B8T3Z5_CAMFR|nr:proline-rich protein 2-like isoform X1 [Camelus ferus]